jgi:hypothetical protein
VAALLFSSERTANKGTDTKTNRSDKRKILPAAGMHFCVLTKNVEIPHIPKKKMSKSICIMAANEDLN